MAELLLSRRRRGDARGALLGAGMGCAAKTCSLFHSLLIKQALDLTLQPRNSTLATVSPVLKSLRLLEEGWRMAEFDHLHTKWCLRTRSNLAGHYV